MYVPPRPVRHEDPLFAVRLGLGTVLALIGVALVQPAMPPMCIGLPLGLMAGQRRAFDPARVLGGAIAFGVLAWVLALVVALTRPLPPLMLLIVMVLFWAGFYVTRRTGSAFGMLILLITALMSIAAMKHPDMLKMFRDAFVSAALFAAVIIPPCYLLIPAATTEKLVETPIPAPGHHGMGALIRAFVLMGLCFWLYAVLPLQDMVLAIAAIFPLIFPTRDEALAEAGERIWATLIGLFFGALILAGAMVSAHPVALLGMSFLAALYFGEKMIDGRLSAPVYQFALSTGLVLVVTALGNADPMQTVVSRVLMTMAGALAAALLAGYLDALLLGVPLSGQANPGPSPHPLVQRRRTGREAA